MKALYNIPYGLYVLTAKDGKDNGCIINTLQQVTSSPEKISITINKDNYTTQMIEKTGVFNVSILNEKTSFDLIKRFGFSSGKDTDKFEGFLGFDRAENGTTYITENTNSYLSAKVVSKTDVGTHITFVAEVTADVVLNDTKSVTYERMYAKFVDMSTKARLYLMTLFVHCASMVQQILNCKNRHFLTKN